MKLRFILAALLCLVPCIAWAQEDLTAEEKGWLAKANRTERMAGFMSRSPASLSRAAFNMAI